MRVLSTLTRANKIAFQRDTQIVWPRGGAISVDAVLSVLLGLAVLLAIAGQFLLGQQAYLPALVLFAAALGIWWLTRGDARSALPAASLGQAGLLDTTRARPLPGWLERHRALLSIITLALAVLTFLSSTNNTFTLLKVSLWFLSIATFLLLFAERPGPIRIANPRGLLAALALVLLLGGMFYYYNLQQLPGEMTSDHAEKILDVNDVLHGARPIFFTRNTGREPLEFYLVAGFVGLTGHRLDHMALKWVTATAGLLVVPLTLLLGTVLFDLLVGSIAAAFVAVNMWGVGIARMGLRFPFTPLFAALTFLFLFRALKHGRRNDFLLAGMFLGAGLYGYHAFKIAPLVVAGCLALWLVIEGHASRLFRRGADWTPLRRYFGNAFVLVVISLIVFMPLLRYMVDHPETFWARVATRISSAEQPVPGNPALVLADNLKNDLTMFNVQGDHSWPNTLSEVPVLDEVTGALFVLGAAYGVYRWLWHRETVYAYVLVALFGFILPSALALAFPIENPSVVRAGGAIPFVMLFAALPLARQVRGLNAGRSSLRPVLAVGVLLPFLLGSAGLNYQRYFVLFDRQYRANSWNSSEMAATILDFARAGGSLDHAWVVAYPYWVDTRNVAINLGHIEWNNVLWHVDGMVDPSGEPSPRLYILDPVDTANIDALHRVFPDGEMKICPSRTDGKEYVAFYVPAHPAVTKAGQ